MDSNCCKYIIQLYNDSLFYNGLFFSYNELQPIAVSQHDIHELAVLIDDIDSLYFDEGPVLDAWDVRLVANGKIVFYQSDYGLGNAPDEIDNLIRYIEEVSKLDFRLQPWN